MCVFLYHKLACVVVCFLCIFQQCYIKGKVFFFSPSLCLSPLECLTSFKECVFSPLWLLWTLTHSPCTSGPAHHGSVTALRSWWGDRKEFWLLYAAPCYSIDWSLCACVSCLTKRSVNTEDPCWVWPPSVSDSTLHLPVTSFSGLSQTQRTLDRLTPYGS